MGAFKCVCVCVRGGGERGGEEVTVQLCVSVLYVCVCERACAYVRARVSACTEFGMYPMWGL